jgi:hypothetical protein
MATTHLTGAGRAPARASDDPECERHDHPDGDEAGEDPQQEGGFAEGQPGQLLACEEESATFDRLLVDSELADLAGYDLRRIVRGTAVDVDAGRTVVASLAHSVTVPRPCDLKTPERTWPRKALAVVAAGASCLALAGASAGAGQREAAAVVLARGDIARVAELPVACRVARRGTPPATMLDCRRAGKLAGSYGVLVGRWNVRVVRFTSAHEARVVLTARQGGQATFCGAGGTG